MLATNPLKPPNHQILDRHHPQIGRKQPQKRPSEILPTLLGYHKKLLVYSRDCRRTLFLEGNLEMEDYLIDGFGISDEGDNLHLTFAGKTEDMAKAAHRIAAVEELLNNILDPGRKFPCSFSNRSSWDASVIGQTILVGM